MIEAVTSGMSYNKPHWDFSIDPGWQIFANMTRAASQSITAEAPKLFRLLSGISPIDPDFIRNMAQQHGVEA
jgi:hypothetical protein